MKKNYKDAEQTKKNASFWGTNAGIVAGVSTTAGVYSLVPITTVIASGVALPFAGAAAAGAGVGYGVYRIIKKLAK
jgi:hypothetical protein